MEQFRPSRGLRAANRVMAVLARVPAPLPIGPIALLTVPGRVSGIPRTTPIALADHADGWTLIAPYGPVDWVKNLRAAGGGTVTVHGRRHQVVATELPAHEAGPVLNRTLRTTGGVARRTIGPYFRTPIDAPAAAWEAEAAGHPVFLLHEVAAQGSSRSG
jgi:deazaflavin-dependent oxidoreductase (nitroreductase family)